jgi:hypothetical protein
MLLGCNRCGQSNNGIGDYEDFFVFTPYDGIRAENSGHHKPLVVKRTIVPRSINRKAQGNKSTIIARPLLSARFRRFFMKVNTYKEINYRATRI